MSIEKANKFANFPADEQVKCMLSQIEADTRIEAESADVDAMIAHYIETGEYKPIEQKTDGLDLQRTVAEMQNGEIWVEQMKGVRAYLAQITGPCAVYKAKRHFIDGDESQLSQARKGRIVYDVTELDDGVYEAQSTWRSMRRHRVYFVLRGGSIEILDDLDAALEVQEAMDY